MTVTCNDCGFSGTLEAVSVHSCYVQEQGGRCEDYPCCGHTDGDGCQTRPEHTSAYWSRMRERMGDEAFEYATEQQEAYDAQWS